MARAVSNEYTPDVVSVPGETLQEVLDERGISQAELANRTGRPKKTINEIIQGKTAITPETALQLERVLGVPAAFWTNLEASYRANLARTSERAELKRHVEWIERLPVADMIRQGWIRRLPDEVDQLQELLSFFGVASPLRWEQMLKATSFRKSSAFEIDMGALTAWLRRGEVEGRRIVCSPFDKAAFREVLDRARALTRAPLTSVFRELQQRCAGAGVALVVVPELPRTRVNGATRWLSKDKALIQLSLRYKREDVFWFSFFHEAGHIVLHGKREVFVDGEPGDSDHEREADAFASNTLIPSGPYRRFVRRTTFPKASVLELALAVGVHPGIVVGRLQHDRVIGFNKLTDLRRPIDPDDLMAATVP
jgi:HTH-type transcriptional regulator/antitoxin HigA